MIKPLTQSLSFNLAWDHVTFFLLFIHFPPSHFTHKTHREMASSHTEKWDACTVGWRIKLKISLCDEGFNFQSITFLSFLVGRKYGSCYTCGIEAKHLREKDSSSKCKHTTFCRLVYFFLQITVMFWNPITSFEIKLIQHILNFTWFYFKN